MSRDLNPEQELLVDGTHKFLTAAHPLTALRESVDASCRVDRNLWRRGCELGWTSLLVPGEYGGGTASGQGLTDLALVARVHGRHLAPGPLVSTNVLAAAIALDGPEDQRQEILPAVVQGDKIASWCLPELSSPTSWWTFCMEAAPRGSGFQLTGAKAMVEAAADADLFLVTARTPQGPTQFLVPSDAHGIEIRPRNSLDPSRSFADVAFVGVDLPGGAILGAPGAASNAIEYQLQLAVCLQCSESTGSMNRVFDCTLQWAFDRYSFGRPLASYQELKHRFADMKLWLEASLATTEGAVRAVQEHSADAPELVSVAKAYVADRALELVQDCVQMHGGIGVTWEHDLHLYVRRLTQNWGIYGNPAEHRSRIAALTVRS